MRLRRLCRLCAGRCRRIGSHQPLRPGRRTRHCGARQSNGLARRRPRPRIRHGDAVCPRADSCRRMHRLPGASVPVQPMPSAARRNTCTPFWKLAARAAPSALRPVPWTALTSLKSAANGRGRMPAKQNFITRKPGRGASVRQPWRTHVLHADAKQRLTYRQRPLLPQLPPPRNFMADILAQARARSRQ